MVIYRYGGRNDLEYCDYVEIFSNVANFTELKPEKFQVSITIILSDSDKS